MARRPRERDLTSRYRVGQVRRVGIKQYKMVPRTEVTSQAGSLAAGHGRGSDDQLGKIARQTVDVIRPCPYVHLLSLIEGVRLLEAAAQHAASHALAVKIVSLRITRPGGRHDQWITERR